MLELIGLIGTGAAAALGYFQSRLFVRKRLAYVDAVQKSSAPWVAGMVAAIMAAPIAWLLPLIGGAAALLFGTGVGLGVSAGAKEVRRRLPSA